MGFTSVLCAVILAVVLAPPSAYATEAATGECPERMVLIRAGQFAMGQGDGNMDERPVHTVYLKAFCMDKYPVTNREFADFLNAMGNRKEEGKKWLDTDCFLCPLLVRIRTVDGLFRPKDGYGDHPVVKVTWYGATAYCKELGKGLPSEAQWEKAARGGLVGKRYPRGDAPDDARANIDRDNTTPVGSFPPNGYGLFDMADNVWEWVEDWYDPDYYSYSPAEDPRGPAQGTMKVLRGGSWFHEDSSRCAERSYDHPKSYTNCFVTGFRCARASLSPGSGDLGVK